MPISYSRLKTKGHSKPVYVLPGVTAVVVIPHEQRRSIGGLARKKNGPEITVRVNDLDKSLIIEGAKRCGLSMADYVRQCAVNMTRALRSQTDAPSSSESS
jgi:hypothetical protein